MNKFLVSTALALSCATLAACGDVVHKPAKTEKLTLASQTIPSTEYLIGPGDEIEVKFFFTPELNDRITVRPDGYISLMFAEDIMAAGQTPKQLAASIKNRLAPHVKQLDLSVVVRSFGSQKVYVGGEVTKPGSVTLTGNQTLLQVLDEAGWIAPTGRQDSIVLLRRDPATGKEEAFVLDVAKIVNGKDVSQNVLVMAGDTILVPPHDAVEFDRWMQRNVRDALPLNGNFTINRGIGPQ